MIQITATALKANLGKYLALAQREEIHVTKNGTDIAVIVPPKKKRSWVDEMTGIMSGAEIDLKKFKSDRLAAKYESLD